MKEILRNWLFNNGIYLDIDNLGQLMKDGRLLLRLLTDYKVVKSEFTVVFKPGRDKFECVYNLRQLRESLEVLGVNFDENVIGKVAEGCFSTCVAVLTDLYSVLVVDGGLAVTNREEKLARLVDKSRFSVQKIDEKALGDGLEASDGYDYSTKFVENKSVIEWYKNKHPLERKTKEDVRKKEMKEINDEKHEKVVKKTFSTKNCHKHISFKLSGSDVVKNCIEEFTMLQGLDSKKLKNEKPTTKIDKIEENVSTIDVKIPISRSEVVNDCIQEFTTLQFTKCTPVLDKTEQDSFFDYRDESNFPHPPLEYVTNLTFAKRKSVEDWKRLEECERFVGEDFLSRLKQEDDEFYNDCLSDMIFKLSSFERVLFEKVYQILHQDRVQRKRLKCFPKKTDFETDNKEDIISRHYAEGLAYYQSEKKRTSELHWRLYADNLKFWYEKVYAACWKTIESIVDFAVKESEYKSLYKVEADDCLKREWKSLFYQNQPLFKADELDLFDVLLVDESCFIEEQTDWLRQDVISNENLDDYLFLEGSWSLKNELLRLDFTPVTREDQKILSYIVYKLLDVKYPQSQKIELPDLPLYPVRAVINDFNESSLEQLRYLLKEQDILLVDINTAINFCVEAFVAGEQEIVERYTLDRKSADLQVPFEKTVTILDKIDSLEGSKVETTKESVGVQTSLSHLDVLELKEENNEAGFVGKNVLENMKTSSEIKVQLIVDAIIAYIQSQKNVIRGWVVVNFPNTLYYASVLESTLSSNRFPIRLKENPSETSFSSSLSTKESTTGNRYDDIKYSKLLLNPQNKTSGANVFTTYFTNFVFMKKMKSLEEKTCGSKLSKASILRNSVHIDSDVLLEQPSNYGAPTLQTFYCNESICNEFCYSEMDTDMLNCLIQVLVNGVLSEDENVTSLMEGELDKHEKQSDDSKSRLALTTSSTSQMYYDSMTALNSMNDSFLFDSNRPSSEMTLQFVDLTLETSHSVNLAELWEVMANTYLNTLHDTLYMLRVHERTVPPYFRMISQAMLSSLTKPDNRQDLVTNFLNDYNTIALPLLLEDDVVVEAHLRATELERELLQLSDDKQKSAVAIRESLIAQQWDRQHLSAICDEFVSLLQAEATRFTRTLEFLQDYYLLGLSVPPKLNHAVHSIHVEDIEKKASNENVNDDPMFLPIIESKVKHVMLSIFKAKESCEALMASTENYLLVEVKRKLDNAVKEVRSSSAKDKKKKKKKSLDEEKIITEQSLQLHADYEKNCQRLKTVLREWLDALYVEVKRAQFRVELIRRRAENYIVSLEKQVEEIFREFEAETERVHREEGECVRKIRKLFGTAIEERTPVLAEVYYKHTDFYVKKFTVELEPEPESIPAILDVHYESTQLSLEQLEILYLRFSTLAPDGLIPKQILIEFFKDVSRTAHCGAWFWDRLTTAKLNKMFNTLFGEMEMCDWRDLLVVSLEMDIPTAEDILDAKLQFSALDRNNSEVVTLENYFSTTLWFEREVPKCPSHNLFVLRVKQFLAKMFQNGDQFVNYSALLLAFCKDVDPIVGFGKALTFLTGRCVIVYKQDEYLEQIYTDHMATGRKVSKMIVEELIGDVVEAVEIEKLGDVLLRSDSNEDNQLIDDVVEAVEIVRGEDVLSGSDNKDRKLFSDVVERVGDVLSRDDNEDNLEPPKNGEIFGDKLSRSDDNEENLKPPKNDEIFGDKLSRSDDNEENLKPPANGEIFGDMLSRSDDNEENLEPPASGDEVLFETIYCPFFRRLKYCNWTTLVPVEVIRSFVKTLYSSSEFPEWMVFDLDKEIERFVVGQTQIVYVPDFVSYIFAKNDFPASSFAVFKISELIAQFVVDEKIY